MNDLIKCDTFINHKHLGGESMKNKLSGKFWCALTLFSLMGQVAWVIENMYLNIFIYKMFNASAGQISVMVSASAITATLTTIFIGALSDSVGKRKLFVSGGYILWGISIFSFVFLKMDCLGAFIPLTASGMVSLVIALDCIMTFLGSSANDAAFNAWITDSTDSSNRGIAEGINAMMPLVAILVVFGGFMSLDTAKSESWTFIFSVIGVLTVLVGILGVFLIKEPAKAKSEYGYFKTVLYGFNFKTVKANPILYIVLVGFIIFNISIQIFMPYLIIYYEITLKMDNYVLVLAPAIIIASIFTAFWGRVYDKKGFKFSGLISVSVLAAGYVILYLFKSTALVFVGSLLMMCGYLSGMAVFGAMIRDNTPQGKSGALQGVRIFSQVFVPGIVGPAISSAVLSNAAKITGNDGVQSFVPNANIFLAALLAVLLLLFYLCVISTKKPPVLQELITPFEDDLSKENPWNDYPRPQLKRKSFISLNGIWNLEYTSKDKVAHIEKILVPFPPESRLSGLGDRFKNVDVYSYARTFNIDREFLNARTIIHFGAVDQIAKVYVNNNFAGEHHGGYTPFEFDISDYILIGNNTVKVDIIDKLDVEYPYGKQRKKRGGMWYTPISGIWQTVWLESVSENYIRNIKISTKENHVSLFVVGGEDAKCVELENKVYDFCGNTFEFEVERPEYWSPENPNYIVSDFQADVIALILTLH